MEPEPSFEVVQAFHRRYLEGEKPKQLLKEMGRDDLAPGQIMKVFPPYPVEGACPLCGGGLERRRLSRPDFQFGRSALPYCTECNHRQAVDCPCRSCIQQRMEARERQRVEQETALAARRMMIEARIAMRPPCTLAQMSDCDPRCLLALASDLFDAAMRPEETGASCVLQRYREMGVGSDWRVPDVMRSVIDAFDESGEVIKEFSQRVAYRWHIDSAVTWGDVCQALRERLRGNNEMLETIWLDIMADECLGFLGWQLMTVSLPTVKETSPIPLVIRRLLTQTSAKLVYKFIRMSVGNAAEFSRRTECKSNSMAVALIKRWLEDHYRNQRDGKYPGQGFRRPEKYLRSTLNCMFFNEVLKGVADVGFDECVADYLPRTRLWRRNVAEGASDRPVCCDCGAVDVLYEQRRSTIRLECRRCGQVQIFEADPMTP